MDPDQTAPNEQSDLCPYCLQYRLHVPKNINRGEKQMTKVTSLLSYFLCSYSSLLFFEYTLLSRLFHSQSDSSFEHPKHM